MGPGLLQRRENHDNHDRGAAQATFTSETEHVRAVSMAGSKKVIRFILNIEVTISSGNSPLIPRVTAAHAERNGLRPRTAERSSDQVSRDRITLTGISSSAREPILPRTPRNAELPCGNLSLLVAQDVGVTGIEDGHGGATEELTASGAQLNLQGKE